MSDEHAGRPIVRRPTTIVVLVAVTIAALVAGWWFFWVPNWRPPLQAGERYGIDVSSHQGDIDWKAVAGDGIEFAYVKATEGGDFVDDRFVTNWNDAGDAGLERGAYHFFTLCTPGDAQAENFLRVAPPREDALSPAVDLELAGNCSDRPPRAPVVAELERFIEMIEDAWQDDVVPYLGNDFESLYEVRAILDRPLWLRRFMLRPDDDWAIWQLHGLRARGRDIRRGRPGRDAHGRRLNARRRRQALGRITPSPSRCRGRTSLSRPACSS